MEIQPLDTPGVTGVDGPTPTTMTSPPPSPQLMGTLDGIAQQLTLTPDQLRSSLAGGSSITDLAAQQGVSRSNLVQSVESQIQQSRQSRGLAPPDQTSLDRMVNRAFDRHGHHRTSGSADTATSTDATVPVPAQVDTPSGIDVQA